MHGSVSEWVQDWYGSDYYDSSPRVDPLGPSTGSERVIRSGGFDSSTRWMRSAARGRNSPDFSQLGSGLGARLLRTDSP